MTPIGRDTCYVVIAAWVCRRRGDTRLRGRRKCRMARYQLREFTEKRLEEAAALAGRSELELQVRSFDNFERSMGTRRFVVYYITTRLID